MNKGTIHIIRGELNWAKVLGNPRLNTFTDEREWSVDVTPDANSRKLLKKEKIDDKLREPKEGDSRTESYMSFRQKEYREDKRTGERVANDPIPVEDVRGQPWPSNKLIGNGSIADVKFKKIDYGKGKPTGAYIMAIRVLEHVPYVVDQFEPLDEDDEYFASSSEGAADPEEDLEELMDEIPDSDEDLDDDVPF